MPESRRRYRWTVRWDDPLMAVAAQDYVTLAIERWGMRWSWFMGGTVSLGEDDQLVVEAVIRGRDQWRVNERQGRLIAAVAATLHERRAIFGEPEVERLAPHRNRGRRATAARCAKGAAEGVRDQ